MVRRCEECLSALQLSETLNQQFSKNPDFPCGVLTRRPDDEHAARQDGIARHHLDKAAGIQTARCVTIYWVRLAGFDPCRHIGYD